MKDIFIGGGMRCGTTLIQNLICQSTQVNKFIGEAEHFFWLFHAYHQGLQQYQEKTRYFFTSKEDYAAYQAELAEQYLHRVRSLYEPDKRLVFKAPWFTRYLPLVFQAVKNSQHIIITRDPRDVMASMLRVGERQMKRKEPTNYVRANLMGMVDELNQIYMPVIQSRKYFGEQILFIRYEDLVTSPKNIMQQLSEFLLLEDLSSLEDNPMMNSADVSHNLDEKQAFFSGLYGQKITNSRIGTYTDTFSTEEIQKIENRASHLIKIFHY